jgi:hypothetical protein
MIKPKAGPILATLFTLSLVAPAQAQLTTSSGSPGAQSISGYDGDTDVEIDLSRGKSIIEISGHQSAGLTCEIEVEGKRLAMNADFETHDAGRCKGSSREAFSAGARYGNLINAVRVCTSSGPVPTVTGLETDSLSLNELGEFGAQRPRDRSYSSDCDRWHNWSRCPAREVMTGLRVYFTKPADGFSGTGYVTGLQALCQDIEVR